MATSSNLFSVMFRETYERNATPEMYVCAAEEAEAIEELLQCICAEGTGPIDNMYHLTGDSDFTAPWPPAQPRMITLKTLKERFEEELADFEVDAVENHNGN